MSEPTASSYQPNFKDNSINNSKGYSPDEDEALNFLFSETPATYNEAQDSETECLLCEEPNSDSFLKIDKVNIRNSKAYKKSRCLLVINDVFVRKYISRFSRTNDQMIQAARSVKQNLVEGAYDGVTSKETEIKLFNVARGSLHELLEDYIDFLDNNNLSKWEFGDARLTRTRQKLITEMNPEWYASIPEKCSAGTCANIIITLIYQVDSMIKGLLEKCERDFITNGGLRETMSKYRISARNNQKKYLNPNSGKTDSK